jgi:hypothetical protein
LETPGHGKSDRSSLGALVFSAILVVIAGFMPWASYTIDEYMGEILSQFEEAQRSIQESGEEAERQLENWWHTFAGEGRGTLRHGLERVGPNFNRHARLDMNAWEDRGGLWDLGLPHWLVPVLATVLAVLAILRERGWMLVSRRVFLLTGLYLVLHTTSALIQIVGEARLRAGLVLALLASAVIVWSARPVRA